MKQEKNITIKEWESTIRAEKKKELLNNVKKNCYKKKLKNDWT